MLWAVMPVLLMFADTVSVRELAVPQKARDKFEDAQRRLVKQDVEGARKRLEEAVALAPAYSAAWNALGVISSSEDHFRRAVEADPDKLDAVLNLGGLLLKTGRAEEALGFNQRAAFALSGDASAQAQLGMNYYQLGRLAESEKALLAAKRLDPDHYTLPQLFLAEIYARQGDKAGARAQIEELLARRPAESLAATLRQISERLK
jgi:tetratricopeptide (TPR) repeat protein